MPTYSLQELQARFARLQEEKAKLTENEEKLKNQIEVIKAVIKSKTILKQQTDMESEQTNDKSLTHSQIDKELETLTADIEALRAISKSTNDAIKKTKEMLKKNNINISKLMERNEITAEDEDEKENYNANLEELEEMAVKLKQLKLVKKYGKLSVKLKSERQQQQNEKIHKAEEKKTILQKAKETIKSPFINKTKTKSEEKIAQHETELKVKTDKYKEEKEKNASSIAKNKKEMQAVQAELGQATENIMQQMLAGAGTAAAQEVFQQLAQPGKDKHITIPSEIPADEQQAILACLPQHAAEIKQLDSSGVPLTGIKKTFLVLFLSTEGIALEKLDLSHTQLTDEDISILVDAVKQNESLHLKDLNLNGNLIGPKAAAAISRLLINNQYLEFLDISQTELGNKGLLHVAEGLRYNTKLKILYLRYNNIGGNKSKLKYKTSLDYENNDYKLLPNGKEEVFFDNNKAEQNDEDYAALQALARALENGPPLLTKLDLGSNYISAKNIIALEKAFHSKTVLTSFNFSDTGLNDAALSVFCSMLSKCPTINTLDISDNDFSVIGLKVLSNVVKEKNILELLIDSCNLDNNAIEAFIPGLAANSSLVEIHLRNNKFNGEIAVELFPALVNQKTLRRLSLSGNALENKNLKLFCDSVAASSSAATLANLHLSNIGLEKNGIRPLIKLYKNNQLPCLTILSLEDNQLADEDAIELAEALQQVKTSLFSLNLGDNNFTAKGVIAVLKGLLKHKNIHSIHFSDGVSVINVKEIVAELSCRPLLPKLLIDSRWSIATKFQKSLQRELQQLIIPQENSNTLLAFTNQAFTDAEADKVAEYLANPTAS